MPQHPKPHPAALTVAVLGLAFFTAVFIVCVREVDGDHSLLLRLVLAAGVVAGWVGFVVFSSVTLEAERRYRKWRESQEDN